MKKTTKVEATRQERVQPKIKQHKGKFLILRPGLYREWLRAQKRNFPEGFTLRETISITLTGETWLRYLDRAYKRRIPVDTILSGALENHISNGGAK